MARHRRHGADGGGRSTWSEPLRDGRRCRPGAAAIQASGTVGSHIVPAQAAGLDIPSWAEIATFLHRAASAAAEVMKATLDRSRKRKKIGSEERQRIETITEPCLSYVLRPASPGRGDAVKGMKGKASPCPHLQSPGPAHVAPPMRFPRCVLTPRKSFASSSPASTT